MIFFIPPKGGYGGGGNLSSKYGIIFMLIFSPLFYFLWTSTLKMTSYKSSGYGYVIVASIITIIFIAQFIFMVMGAIEEKEEEEEEEWKRKLEKKWKKKEKKRLKKLNKEMK